MDIKKINTKAIFGKKVLVAPLDWGLGHATRCIPIIKALLKRQNTVIIAAGSAGRALLSVEFPQISIVELPDYNVRLGVSWRGFSPGLLLQMPRLWAIIKKETKWLADFCNGQSVDLIISDNRYGLFHKDIHSVFITHQLFIRSGLGESADRWLMKMHYRLMARFNECWVPDNVLPERSLAGRLSHPPTPAPVPVTYIGGLSRFVEDDPGARPALRGEGLLILLSGPEPQRTLIETVLRKQLQGCTGPVLLVRGLPGKATGKSAGKTVVPANWRIVDHLPADGMRNAMTDAGTIVCRSGYSTVMDLIALRRTAVLVPTPGQPEQEYLAGYLSMKGWMTMQRQADFSFAALPGRESRTASETLLADPGAGCLFFTGELPPLTLP